MPARSAFLMPCVPIACAATRKPCRCASSIAAVELVGRQLRVAGDRAFGQDAAGRNQLDAIGAGPHLLAHGFTRVPRRIDGATDRPAVTAGHAEHRPGGAHTRAGNAPFFDRVAHVWRDTVRAADVADRRDAGLDRFARVLDRAQQPLVAASSWRSCPSYRARRCLQGARARLPVPALRRPPRDRTRRVAARNSAIVAVVETIVDIAFRRLERAVVKNSGPDDHRAAIASGLQGKSS